MNYVSQEMQKKLEAAGWDKGKAGIGELLEALPREIYDGNPLILRPSLGGDYWLTYYGENDIYQQTEKNPADALASLWLALKEKNLI